MMRSIKRNGWLQFVIIIWLASGDVTNAQSLIRLDSSHAVMYQPKGGQCKIIYCSRRVNYNGALGISGEFIIPDGKIKAARDKHFAGFHTTVDNYLQFAPMAAGYAMLINNKQHSFWKYTGKVVLTEVIVNALVQPDKHLTKVPRPDDRALTSFPSGHTAQAFAGAVIFCEFAQHNTWLTVSAYVSSAAVGLLRILNNRHWASDVIEGAGFGMASAKLSEWIVQPGRRKRQAIYHYQL